MNVPNENVTDDWGWIVPTSQCVWSKITFSRLVTDDEVDATEVRSFCKTISTLFNGAVPAFEIRISIPPYCSLIILKALLTL